MLTAIFSATKTEGGVYVVVKDPGNGPQVDSGKQVLVHYTGKLFPSGKVFESNMTGPGNEPLKFVIGRHQVIPGWDDGLKQFRQGGKGTLYIPAFLAYDQRPGPGQTAIREPDLRHRGRQRNATPRRLLPRAPACRQCRICRPGTYPGAQPRQRLNRSRTTNLPVHK